MEERGKTTATSGMRAFELALSFFGSPPKFRHAFAADPAKVRRSTAAFISVSHCRLSAACEPCDQQCSKNAAQGGDRRVVSGTLSTRSTP
jgi:hypothetical protein